MPSRRSVLRNVGAGAGLVVLNSVAGCQQSKTAGERAEEQFGPQASFDVSYDSGDREATLEHVGGDSFDRENTDLLKYGVEGGEMQTWSLPVAAGDSTTIESGIEPNAKVVVLWNGPAREKESPSKIFLYVIPG